MHGEVIAMSNLALVIPLAACAALGVTTCSGRAALAQTAAAQEFTLALPVEPGEKPASRAYPCLSGPSWQLMENRAKWDALRITSYSFTLWMNGAWGRTTPIQILVRKGRVISVHYMLFDVPRDGSFRWESRESMNLREGPVAEPSWWMTIPGLFARAEEVLYRPGADTVLKFHPKFGVPTEIASVQRNMHDSQFALWLNDFEVLR
jgi:hypothetical protein